MSLSRHWKLFIMAIFGDQWFSHYREVAFIDNHSIEGAKMVAKYVRIIVALNYLERVNG